MDGIDKITARISVDSQREADELLAQAQAQADSVKREYADRAARESADILERGRKAAAERVERMAGVAQLEGRKAVLAAQQALIARAFDRALEQLCTLPQEKYTALLSQLAVKAARSGKEALIFSKADRSRYGKAVVIAANEALEKAGRTASLTLSQETRPLRGGFIMAEGKVETNCAFETLVRLQREGLSRQVAGVLFES